MLRSLLASALLALGGCAISHNDLAQQAANRGDYAKAERLLMQSIQEGDDPGVAWHNLGYVYSRMGQEQKALEAVRVSARYGFPAAQQVLVRMGQPVPSADLAQAGQQRMSAAEVMLILSGAAAQGYVSGRQAAPVVPLPALPSAPKQVNCTSTTLGNTTSTTCR